MDDRYPWLDAFLLARPGCTKDHKLEWGWDRYQVGGKLFAATCCPGPEHGAFAGRPLLTLKCDPALSELLRAEQPDIVPGFYMDKRHWISIFRDGTVPEEIVRDLCLRSYALVFGKLTKKLQREIQAAAEET